MNSSDYLHFWYLDNIGTGQTLLFEQIERGDLELGFMDLGSPRIL